MKAIKESQSFSFSFSFFFKIFFEVVCHNSLQCVFLAQKRFFKQDERRLCLHVEQVKM
jgi:hypothetical protein